MISSKLAELISTTSGFYIHNCIKMRYKSAYQPAYVLDPETYTWDPLNADILQRLSARVYVSMSRERRLGLPPTSISASMRVSPGGSSNPEVSYNDDDIDYIEQRRQESESRRRKQDNSIFEVGMPGVMTVEELQRDIELGKWDIKLASLIVKLEVQTRPGLELTK